MTQVSKHLRKRTHATLATASPPPASPRRAARARGPIDRLLDADLFRALSDPTRLNLLACLIKCARPCAVSEIASCCKVDLSVVSRHLAQLARAGLIRGDKQGRVLLYSPCSQDLASTLRELASAIDACAAACECGPDCCPAPTTHLKVSALKVLPKEPRS
ncbi:MAG: metalloregulator ArsR/SmtB family transcription factor [Phycisphaerales bacterium]